MHPTLLKLLDGKLVFHAYPTMLAIAFIVGALGASRQAARAKPPINLYPAAGIFALVGALFGAKLFWFLQFDPANFWKAIYIWQGGLVYYGGLLGGAAGLVLYARIFKAPLAASCDIAAPYLALGQGITRIGCFLNGCCWGAVTHLPWAVRFPSGCPAHMIQKRDGLIAHGAEYTLPVHPTQLYMVVGLAAIFIVLKLALDRPRRFPGSVLLGYLFLYGLLRFTVESVRGDSARSVAGMTVSQAISLMLAVAAVVLYAALTRGRELPAAPADEHAGEAHAASGEKAAETA